MRGVKTGLTVNCKRQATQIWKASCGHKSRLKKSKVVEMKSPVAASQLKTVGRGTLVPARVELCCLCLTTKAGQAIAMEVQGRDVILGGGLQEKILPAEKHDLRVSGTALTSGDLEIQEGDRLNWTKEPALKPGGVPGRRGERIGLRMYPAEPPKARELSRLMR